MVSCNMFQTLMAFFKKGKPITIADLTIGDLVEVSYHHPKDLGFFTENQLTCTRLNPDELDNRKIKGIVIRTFKNPDIFKWFIEIKTQKIYDGFSVDRCFLLMETEIEMIRRIS